MSQYLLLNRIKVQGANAIAGFTWGFPAITHFMGYTHNLSRKLSKHQTLSDIFMSGCAVISHQQQVHTYGHNQFVQSRNPPYLVDSRKQYATAPVIEEGKMNMKVSLLISIEGNVGNRKETFMEWLDNVCKLQRLAGGTVLDISDIELFTIDNSLNRGNLRALTRKLLPGFILLDRSNYLEEHYLSKQRINPETELFDAWLDFIALKQKARPAFKRIDGFLQKTSELEEGKHLFDLWQKHLENPYEQNLIPEELKKHFTSLPKTESNRKTLLQWKAYIEPNEKTDAVWEYLEKPRKGFLVPLMVGYKAISPVYPNKEVANTRDNETDVCFVEAVHSIGEWQSVHRLRKQADLAQCLWQYEYKEHWYLCKQISQAEAQHSEEPITENPNDDFL